MQSSIRSRKEIKTFWKNFEKMLLVVHLLCSHGKQLLMKLSFESQQIYANLLLELTLASYTPTRCVNPCAPVSIRVGIWIQKRLNSYLDKTRPAALKIWSCLIFKVQDLIVNFLSFFTTGRQKKIDCFSVDGFCFHCNTVFEAMGCFYHFCLCQELRPSFTEKEIQRGSKKRELDALRRHYIQEKTSRLLKCGSANGGDCTKHPTLFFHQTPTKQQTTYPRTLSLQAFTCSWATFRRDKERKVIWLRAVRYWSTWKFESKLCELPSNIQEHLC